MAERYSNYNKLPKNEAKIQFLANIEIISPLVAQGNTYKKIHKQLIAQNKISMSYSAFAYNARFHFPKKRKVRSDMPLHGNRPLHKPKRFNSEKEEGRFYHNNTPDLDDYLYGDE